MIRDVKSGAEMRREAEEVEEAEETGEDRNRCLPAARWFFDDVLFSRIALTTLAQWGGIPIVLRYRKRTGGKTVRTIEFFALELRGKRRHKEYDSDTKNIKSDSGRELKIGDPHLL